MRRALGVVLIALGLLAVADAALTVLWREPVTAIGEHRAQVTLRRELRAMPVALAPAAALHRDGRALGELRIRRIGLDVVALTSARPQDLRRGPGLIAPTTLPGRGRTTALAGHRTTYGAPFRHLDDLRHGDPIVLRTPYATFRYAVASKRIVAPTDLAVLANRGRDRLVLSACHPLFSAAQRIVVTARLTSVERSATTLKTTPGATR